MLQPGVYPAAVTPFGEKGRVDYVGVAKLLAWFEANGCKGAVLAGTNGEGPSLSATEKRELIERAMPLRGSLELVLGIATPSIEEAVWLSKKAADAGAVAVLAMPPSYFREAPLEGVRDWFRAFLDRSHSPALIYNFPRRTGFTLSADLLADLAGHPQMIGAKDSSGEAENISAYAAALPGKKLFVGDETQLWAALNAGWTGTISGAANVVPDWLSQIVREFVEDEPESPETKFEILLPVLQAIRSAPQPATHKVILQHLGVLPRGDVRLPLTRADKQTADSTVAAIESALGPRK